MRTLFLLAFVVILTLGSKVVRAEEFDCQKHAPAKDRIGQKYLERIEKRYGQISNLGGEFVQQSYFAGLEKSDTSKGTVRFKFPGRMDWLYLEPTKQRFVSDGESVWFYQPELKQVTIGDFKDAFDSDLPVSFLLGLGSLQRDFQIKNQCKTAAGIILELAPKQSTGSLQQFHLLVSAKDFTPLGAKVVDVGGNITAIRLLKLDLKKTYAESEFRFDIPLHVDIIDNRRVVHLPEKTKIEESDLMSAGTVAERAEKSGGK